MTDSKQQILRQQISEPIAEPALLLEKRVARALADSGEFLGVFTAEELAVVMRKVLYTLVAEQKVAGVDVPLTHNVTRMEVSIVGHEATVSCELHIHAPIQAFIIFDYVLENDGQANNGRLLLKGNQLNIKEITRPFDVAARTALKVMNVRRIALKELSNVNLLIMRTLPPQLRAHGFEGALATVALELQDGGGMAVYLAAD